MSACRCRDEDGLTLVELLVTISLLGVLLTALTTSFITMQRATAESDQRVEDLGQAQTAMSSWSRLLRGAIKPPGGDRAFVTATADRIEAYTAVGGEVGDPPVHIVLEVEETADGFRLRETMTPSEDGDTGYRLREDDARSRIVARNLGSSDVFVFHTANTPDATFVPDVDDAASLNQIRAVTVELEVAGGEHLDAGGTTLTNRVRLPNLRSE